MRNLLIVLVVLMSMLSERICAQEKLKVYYVYDPLCGWCFAYAGIIEKLGNELKDQVDIVVVPGGMITGDRVRPVGEMAPYILASIPRLEQLASVRMGQAYIDLLKEGSYVMSSEKPSLAMVVFKSFQTDKDLVYAHAVQNALFVEGKDIMGDTLYRDLALSFKLSPDEFMNRMADSSYWAKMHEHFDFAAYLGVKGYPSLVGKDQKGKYHKLVYGYSSEAETRKALMKFIGKK